MNQLHRIIFISDIHLDERQQNVTNVFLQYIEQFDNTVDSVYILGDMFELWIGDDDNSSFLNEIRQAIKKITNKGILVFLIRGNRDFLLGSTFESQTGCKILDDETCIYVYGEKVLLMHGDTLCTDDHAYQRARKIMHNKLAQTLFLFLPLSIRKYIATKCRQASKKHTKKTPKEIMDVNQNAVETVMRKHQVKTLIHGHTHRGNIHRFELDNNNAKRVVLNAWHDNGSAYIWDESGAQELKTIHPES